MVASETERGVDPLCDAGERAAWEGHVRRDVGEEAGGGEVETALPRRAQLPQALVVVEALRYRHEASP
jgi:hypothetical protein